MWQTLGLAFKDRLQMPFVSIKTVMQTIIVPTLVSGLQALVMSKKQLDKLDDFYKSMTIVFKVLSHSRKTQKD